MSDSTAVWREQRWNSADGLTLYSRVYEAAGPAAPALLCLPGLTRNSRDFELLAPHLASRYRVICPDLRGRGFSQRDPHWRNYHPGVYLQDLQRLLEVLELPRVAIIGTSLGGLLAMLLAASAPRAVAGIVLNDIGPEADPRGIERIRGYTGKLPPVRTWAEALAQFREVNGAAWPGLSAEQWSVVTRRSYREDASGTPVFDSDPMIGEAIRAAAAVPQGLWPVFAQITAVPLLAIRGAQSDLLSSEIVERMQRAKPDLESLTVEQRGHAPLLDEPGVVPAIERFLARLSFASGAEHR
jgi:pimeloyl-ACP methyl ester carboxylesterase